MTRGEIFIQIISEVSGKPKQEVKELFLVFRESSQKWDEKIPSKEASKLLSDLRAEAPGIRAWLVKKCLRGELTNEFIC